MNSEQFLKAVASKLQGHFRAGAISLPTTPQTRRVTHSTLTYKTFLLAGAGSKTYAIGVGVGTSQGDLPETTVVADLLVLDLPPTTGTTSVVEQVGQQIQSLRALEQSMLSILVGGGIVIPPNPLTKDAERFKDLFRGLPVAPELTDKLAATTATIIYGTLR